MKLKDYARQQGVSYRTAWRWWKAGKLPGHQMDTGTILIEPSAVAPSGVTQHVAVYVRVSSADNKGNLESQAERLAAYCAACRLLCGLPPTVRHVAIKWRRWSKKWGPVSTMPAQSCLHSSKISLFA